MMDRAIGRWRPPRRVRTASVVPLVRWFVGVTGSTVQLLYSLRTPVAAAAFECFGLTSLGLGLVRPSSRHADSDGVRRCNARCSDEACRGAPACPSPQPHSYTVSTGHGPAL